MNTLHRTVFPTERPGLIGTVLVMLLMAACGGGGSDAGSGGGGGTPPDTTAPTVPAGLTATAQSATQIQLVWQASTDSGAGVAGYRVFRNGATTPTATVTGALSYLDAGLTAQTAYTYVVRAFDAATPSNESAASATVSATTLAAGAPDVSGLDPPGPVNASCLAGEAPSSSTGIALERVFAGLPAFNRPLLMLQEPSSTARWYVVEQTGAVYRFNNQSNVTTRSLFVNVASQIDAGNPAGSDERGLLGMAFHPDFPTNPRVYLSYSASQGGQQVARVVEYRSTDGGQTLDPNSRVTILQGDHPALNHYGGNIAFGPDGYLYISRGDGGGVNDDHGSIGNGQRLSTLLGKMLRIDVNGTTGATPYAIPADNPYAGGAVCNNDTGGFSHNCPEIYAYGFRNPWRWSFDRGPGNTLWVGDVGQENWEEVNRVVRGGNYGWRCREGAHAFNGNCGPNASSAIDPVAEYDHSAGYSMTGGFVYRGTAIPGLVGRYVFGDFGGRIWSIPADTAPTLRVTAASGFESNMNIASFAQDTAGEIYVLNYNAGSVHRLRAAEAGGGQVPNQLTATGCVASGDPTQPAAGLIPYRPNAPFWSDGASKARFLALPNGARIGVDAQGDFDLPSGSVLMKNFRLGNQLIETRLLMRHNNGVWAGYTYEWNTAGTEATRVVGGKTVTVGGQSWLFPSEAQCLLCHTSAAGRSLGLEIPQLNGLLTYPQTGRTANQLTTLNTLNLLMPQLAQPPAQLPALPDPYGTSGTLAERARAWLHTNCSHCHRPGGPTNSAMDLRYTTALAQTNTCNVTPTNNLGVAGAQILAVGGSNAAARSTLVLRADRTDSNAMPPLLPRVVDTAGVALLRDWINSLPSCS